METNSHFKIKLMQIAEKYATLAMNETRIDLVKKYISVVERTFRLVMEYDKNQIAANVDPIYKFGVYIDRPMIRSEVYDKYIEFCEAIEIEPLSRNLFYRKLREMGFKDKSASDNEYFVPPAKLKTKVSKVKEFKLLSDV